MARRGKTYRIIIKTNWRTTILDRIKKGTINPLLPQSNDEGAKTKSIIEIGGEGWSKFILSKIVEGADQAK